MKYRFAIYFLIFLVVLVSGIFLIQPNEDFETYSPEKFRDLTLEDQMALFDSWSEYVSFDDIRTFLYEEAYPDDQFRMHPLAHKLGEIAIEQNGFDGFSLCDSKSQYGCFHGAAIELIHNHGLDNSVIENMLSTCRETEHNAGHCIHGVGHSLTVLSGYDIPESYEQCDELVSDEYKVNCYRGVSMENTTHLTGRQYESFSFSEQAYDCKDLDFQYQKECINYYIIPLMQEENMTLEEGVDYCRSYESSDVVNECVASASTIVFRKSGGMDQFSNNEAEDMCDSAGEYKNACLFGIARHFYAGQETDRFKDLCSRIGQSSLLKERCEIDIHYLNS